MNKMFIYSIIFMIVIVLITSILSMGTLNNYELYKINPEDIYVSSKGFTWPIPNVYYISSYFGYRNINLYGAATYHSGIDIPAPEGTYFLAASSGTVTYLGFSGSRWIYYYY